MCGCTGVPRVSAHPLPGGTWQTSAVTVVGRSQPGDGAEARVLLPARPSTGCTGAGRAVGGNRPSGTHSGCAHTASARPSTGRTQPVLCQVGDGVLAGHQEPLWRGRRRLPGQGTTQGRRLGPPPSQERKIGRGQTSPRSRADVCHLPSPTPTGHLLPFLSCVLQLQMPLHQLWPVAFTFPSPVLSPTLPHPPCSSTCPFLPLCQALALPHSQQ